MQTVYFNVIAMTISAIMNWKSTSKKKQKKKNYWISFPWSWLPNEFTLLMPRTWWPRAFHPQGTGAKATSVNPPQFLYLASGSLSVSFKLSFCRWQVYFALSKIYSPVQVHVCGLLTLQAVLEISYIRIAPPWGLFRHTEVKKIKDKNIYNKEEKWKKSEKKSEKRV